MTLGPVDIFFEWLSTRSADARMAVVVDVDRLLADAGTLGKAVLADKTGRTWRLVVFRGDDLAFRLAYRQARDEKHVLVVLARGTAAGSRIDVSYVTDILAGNEGGPPLDLSIPAVFRRLCPKINFPEAELRRFADALFERIEAVPKAAGKIVERWGRPDDWGCGQVAALVLLCRHPAWVLADLWPDETDPAAAVTHGLRVLLSVPGDSDDLPIIRQMLQGALRPQAKDHFFWFEAAPEQVAAYLLVRAFALDSKLQNPVIQLIGLQIFPLEMPLDKLESDATDVIARLRSDAGPWRLVEQRAEAFLTPKRSERLASLLPAETSAKTIGILTSPAMLLPYLRRGLLRLFVQTGDGDLAWAAGLDSHAAVKSAFGEDVGLRRQCRAAVRLAGGIKSIESRLAATIPAFAHADELLDWYVGSGHHRLELEAARALHDLHACEDDELSTAGQAHLFGSGDELAPAPGSLGHRIRQRLDVLDLRLAKFVEADPAAFANGARSVVGFLNGELQDELTPILTGDSDRRIWVLIFDGMRYDTWEAVVQPVLGEHFTISGQPRFCVLPSYTQFARAGLLAGAPPSAWATGKSHSESSLFAKNIGLAAHEVKEKLRLLSDADTTKARAVLGFTDKAVKPVNVLIYPISDECHEYRGDLASFNNKIRQEIVGDPLTGIRGVLDDLLRRVRPGDFVLATSDHGFVELPSDTAVVVGDADAATHEVTVSESVFFRYAKGFRPVGLTSCVSVVAGKDLHYLCVGRQWLRRQGVGTSVRYSHGGLSLSEVVIPAFR
ncbi:MAG: PglZ domain-containing protein, partial [Planctomycetota bacterium]|nr:PglZ domain-containing protein [Planctomycetota bacterium]